ncbi:MAG: HAD family phosphatase [Anaerocolumna sp.]
MKIKGAIFDLDGTLLDSMFIWDTIGGNYLQSRGITPMENLNETFKNMSLKEAAQYYRKNYGLTEDVKTIVDGVNQMIGHYYYEQVLPKEGIKEFLDILVKEGVKMCVATATDLHLADAALKRTGLRDYFCSIITCTGVGSGKDKPKIFETALLELGSPKENTVVFEDALYAVQTAKEAGFTVVGVYDSSEADNEETIKKRVDIFIRSFHEMRNYID